MTAWSSSYVTALPDSAFACPDSRKYPHHNSSGALDLPHLRAALSRIGDPSNEQCGKAHLQAHAASAGVGEAKAQPVKAEALDEDGMVAWFEGRRPRRLLAIPFGGMYPSPHYAKGMDADKEFFSERTDIKPGWLEYRKVDWHHSWDDFIGSAIIGKADRLGSRDGQDEPDEDGWWVDQWFERGQKYVASIRKLIERGTEIFGSSQSVAGMVKKADTGEILRWPYWRQTLSPTPRNIQSILSPLKATSDFSASDWDAISDELRTIGSELRLNTGAVPGDDVAKAGRVLSGINEQDIDDAVAALLGSADKLRSVLARHRKEPMT